jgi:hypothetical protein
MSAADDDDTPLIIELVEECGFNPIDLSTEVAALITLTAKAAKEIIRNNIHYILRDVAQ